MEISELYNIFLAHPEITTDSRDCPAGSMFFALKGASFNGNLFAAKALELGCSYAVVDEKEVIPANDERYILVDDVLKTMQDLAHYHREQFHGPVIEVTGTNGKTTTKELITAVLSKKYNVLSTAGNFNNHIGVPKTLLRLKPILHQIAVIETGANHPGEIAFLAKIVDPDCGLITNVGRAHLEGFGSFEGVIRTKGELYDYIRTKQDGFIFLNSDNPHLCKISQGMLALHYGEPSADDEKMVEGEVVECSPFLVLRWRRGKTGTWHKVETHLIGAYNLQNALAAACVGTRYGVSESDITEALASYVPKNDRSELRITASNRLIVDAYNANPSSMNAAISNFALMKGEHKMVILGDMRELGTVSEEEHQKIISQLQQQSDLEEVWLVGENFQKAQSNYRCFKDVEEVKAAIAQEPISRRLILIKGSNGTRLFQLPELL